MWHRFLTFIVLAASSLQVAGSECAADGTTPAPAPSAGATTTEEKAALDAFRIQSEENHQWLEERMKKSESEPEAGIARSEEIFARLKAIKTDGLPPDLIADAPVRQA